MSKVYALNNDYTKFQDLDLDLWDIARQTPDDVSLDDVNEFSIRNTSFKHWWPTPETHFIKNVGFDGTEIPDLSHWTNGTLILSPKSYRLLGDLLRQSGELLPVIVSAETYYIYNCQEFGDEDLSQTKFSYIDEQPFELIELSFTPETSNKLLFKSKSQNCVTLFCNDQFKKLIQDYELKGLSFDENLLLAQ